MATNAVNGDCNYEGLLIANKSASATIDTITVVNGTLTVDSDTRYCNSSVGAATANNGSFDICTINAAGGAVVFDGTSTKLIPYKSGSGTPTVLHTAIVITGCTWSSGVVTITTAAHGIAAGTQVRIRVGSTTAATRLNGYNGLFDAIYGSATTLKYALADDPGAVALTANSTMTRYYQISQLTGSATNITAGSVAGAAIPYVATVTAAGHGLAAGDWIIVSGTTPAGYSTTGVVRSVAGDDFTYWVGASATAWTSGGTVQKYVRSSFQSVWTTFAAGLPNPTGTNGAAVLGGNGWIKVKNVQGGNFTAGALVTENSITATAIGAEVSGWIEIVGAEGASAIMTVPRLGSFTVTGDWFYPRLALTNTSTSITNSTTTATLTKVAHLVTVGSIITVSGATPSAYNGTFEVLSVPTADTLTYTMLSNPGGNATVQGDFSTQICCTGVANQTIQLPSPVTGTYYPGVWIETSKGGGTYEMYTATGLAAGTTTAQVGTEAARGKVCLISSAGVLRIGHDGTNVNMTLPAVGCKIRVGNVLLNNTLKASTVGANTNAVPNATGATRYDFATSGGVLNIDKASINWYMLFASPYSVSITNTIFSDQMNISECATPMTLTDVGNGTTDATRTAVALTLTLCFAGGTFTRTRWNRNTNGIVVTMTDCFDFVFSDTVYRHYPLRTSATSALTLSATRVSDSTWTTTSWIGASPSFITCTNITSTTNVHIDVAGGVTPTSVGTYWFSASANTSALMWDGVSFGGLTDQAPYAGFCTLLTGANNIKVRNAGTAASPLALNSTNKVGAVGISASNAGCKDIEFKRLYFSGQRTGTRQFTAATWDNSISGVICESVWTGADTADTGVSLNTTMRGVGATTAATAGTAALYGQHFVDYFTSSTVGKIRILGNEKTSAEPSASAYVIDTAGVYCSFDSAGSFLMPNVNDQITWLIPQLKGHKSFPTTIPVVVTGGATLTNIDLYYELTQGASTAFTGTFKNLLYNRAGGGGGSGFTFTVTSTTGIAVNDYIYGTNIGTAAKVQSIDSSTQITATVTCPGAVSGVIQFSALPNETVTSADSGFRLKVRAKTNTKLASNKITNIAIATVVDATSKAYQYPLDVVDVTVTVKDASTLAAVENARVRITTDTGGYVVLEGVTNSSGVLTGTTEYASHAISGTVRRATVASGTLYKPGSISGTTTSAGFSVTILLTPDE